MVANTRVEVTRKSHRPLRFALGLASASGLIVAIPLAGPRLLAGSKWDQPDVRPAWELKEPGIYLDNLSWSRDGKRLRYFVESYANRSWSQGTLTRTVRTWPEGREVSRTIAGEGDSDTMLKLAAASDERWPESPLGSYGKSQIVHGLHLEVDRGPRVQRRDAQGRMAPRNTKPRLLVKSGSRVLRAWPLPEEQAGYISHEPFLSPDGRLAMVFTSWQDGAPSSSPYPPQDLWDALNIGHYGGSRFEVRQWRIADGKMILRRSLEDKAWGSEHGSVWLGTIQSPLLFDRRGLWCPITPVRVPRNADALLSWAQASQRTTAPSSKPGDDYEARVQTLRAQSSHSQDLLLYDVLGHSTRRFALPGSRPLPLDKGSWGGWLWSATLSRDRRLLAGILAASGPAGAFDGTDVFSLCVWDFASRRLLWRLPRHERTLFNNVAFSPDSTLIALTRTPDTNDLRRISILVLYVQTGKPIGPPLLEESPRQRFEDARANWVKPFQEGARRASAAFATPTPMSSSASDRAYNPPPDAFSFFSWAPDSRHILAWHSRSVLKVWRVPTN